MGRIGVPWVVRSAYTHVVIHRPAALVRAANYRLVTFTLALCLGLLCVTSVFAHAEPATAKPGHGAVLTTSPASYEIEMTQEMARQAGANDIDVFDPSGKEVTTVSAVIDNANRRKLTVALPPGLPAGKYRVDWKTLSADDGDPATGSLSFTVDPTATPSAGKERLKTSTLDPDTNTTPSGTSGAVATNAPKALSGSKASITWVSTIAVGLIMFALGAGTTYVVMDRKK